MKLPKLPAPMTAKFVYPDMSELKLPTGCLSSRSIRALPSSHLFFFHIVDVQLLPIRPSQQVSSASLRAIGAFHLNNGHAYQVVHLRKVYVRRWVTTVVLPSMCLRIELRSESAHRLLGWDKICYIKTSVLQCYKFLTSTAL